MFISIVFFSVIILLIMMFLKGNIKNIIIFMFGGYTKEYKESLKVPKISDQAILNAKQDAYMNTRHW